MGRKQWKLTTIIGAAITALVVVTAFSVALPLYLTYDAQLAREFRAKTEAEASRSAAQLQADLAEVRARVQNLAARMTAPDLGAPGPALGALALPPGAVYLGMKDLEIVGGARPDPQVRELARALMSGELPEGTVIRTPDGRPFIGHAAPVRGGADAVTAVAGLYPLERFPAAVAGRARLLADLPDRTVSLATGRAVDLRLESAPPAPPLSMAEQARLDGEPGLWMALPGFGQLSLFMPLEELEHTRRAGMGVALGLTLLTVAVGIVVSIVLGRLLARPLARMALAVRRVAEGVAEPGELEEDSRITELGECSRSLLNIVSNLKRAEELKRYQELFESVGEAVCMLSREGEILEANEVAPAKFGIAREQFLGTNAFDFVCEHRREQFRSALEEVVDHGREVTIETSCEAPDGRTYETEHHMRRAYVDGRPAALSVNIDITRRKRMERDLIGSKQAAESANRAKNEFLANMSHELRTPLNAVMGLLDVLAESRLDAEQRTCVDVARRSAASLLTIISDILDITKMEAGKLLLCHDTFHPEEMLSGILETFGAEAAAKGLDFRLDVDPDLPEMLVGDAGRIRQVLFNVVGNAVKFTAEGSVAMAVAPEEDPDGEGLAVRFTVTDTGIGIPPEMQALVFDPFTQADGSHSRTHQGTGLGLGLVRRLVNMMNGTLALESEPGRGTRMDIVVPLGRAESAEPPPLFSRPPQEDGFCCRVLLVEDNPSNRLTIEAMLELVGHTVISAGNGQQALELLSRPGEPFDLVLMDVQMPEMDGLDASRAIRAHPDPRVAALPIVAVTAHAMQDDRNRCLEAGMDDYLTKPVRKAVLAETIRRVMAERGPRG